MAGPSTDRDHSYAGRCLCGGVTVEARGAPDWVGICHCASCRRATGGACVAAAGFREERVELRGATLATFRSSPGVTRSFCAMCGTSLAFRGDRWPGDVHLMVGTFDAPENLAPHFHIFFGGRLPWLSVCDGLPRYRTTPGEGLLMNERGEGRGG